jgi:hypothetical protein
LFKKYRSYKPILRKNKTAFRSKNVEKVELSFSAIRKASNPVASVSKKK